MPDTLYAEYTEEKDMQLLFLIFQEQVGSKMSQVEIRQQ